MKETITSEITAQIGRLCVEYRVRALYLFGSVLTNRFNEQSDIDFIVEFMPDIPLLDYADNYLDFADALTELLNRRVDLVSESTLTNPYFIEQINRTKQLIYAA